MSVSNACPMHSSKQQNVWYQQRYSRYSTNHQPKGCFCETLYSLLDCHSNSIFRTFLQIFWCFQEFHEHDLSYYHSVWFQWYGVKIHAGLEHLLQDLMLLEYWSLGHLGPTHNTERARPWPWPLANQPCLVLLCCKMLISSDCCITILDLPRRMQVKYQDRFPLTTSLLRMPWKAAPPFTVMNIQYFAKQVRERTQGLHNRGAGVYLRDRRWCQSRS